MAYFSTITTSTSPQAEHVHVSFFAPSMPNGAGAGSTPVRRAAGSPQALHSLPGAGRGLPSMAASRRSNSSIRAGASRIRFHSPHRSNAASTSWSKDNGHL